MGPDRELVESRLESLREALAGLAQLRGMGIEEYRSDLVRRSAAERLLCRVVEVAAEVNAHIAARVLGEAPADYRDSFLKIAEAGVVTGSFAREIARSAGLRNRIVHEYEVVDHAIVLEAIPTAIEQFRAYLTYILAYLDRSAGSRG